MSVLINTTDPLSAGVMVFFLFYCSVFLSVSGLLFLAIDMFKARFAKQQVLMYRVRTSMRHSLLFAVAAVGWAILKSNNVLAWWNFILLIMILAALEFLFMSSKTEKNFYEGKDSTDQGII
jgi:hypothetical protein